MSEHLLSVCKSLLNLIYISKLEESKDRVFVQIAVRV